MLPADRKRYRASSENLMKLRNMMAMAAQILPHLRTVLSKDEVDQMECSLEKDNSIDDDFLHVLENRFESLSLSMLPSQKAISKRKLKEKEAAVLSEAPDILCVTNFLCDDASCKLAGHRAAASCA